MRVFWVFKETDLRDNLARCGQEGGMAKEVRPFDPKILPKPISSICNLCDRKSTLAKIYEP